MHGNAVRRSSGFIPSHGSKALRIVGWSILGVVFAVVFALVFGYVVMLLWNWLMPAIFGLGKITYWQAFGLVILAKLLFGAFGHHRHGDPSNHFHRKFKDWRDDAHAEKKDDEMMEGWKYYKQYWQDKGKAAFEDYIRRMENQEEKEDEG